jgi:hypothetical protein
MHSFDAGTFAGQQGRDRIGMAGSDPSGETGIMKMADNAAAEKSGAAKNSHARRHDAKVSRRLRLSYSHSTGDQSRHRPGAFSQPEPRVVDRSPHDPFDAAEAVDAVCFHLSISSLPKDRDRPGL